MFFAYYLHVLHHTRLLLVWQYLSAMLPIAISIYKWLCFMFFGYYLHVLHQTRLHLVWQYLSVMLPLLCLLRY